MQNFQAFTVKFDGRTNALFCDVGVSQAFNPKTTTVNQPQAMQVLSIWDTGATCTVITKHFATQIGLIPTGKNIINGVNGQTEENTYFVNVYLPNRVCITDLKIVEVPGIFGGAGMLIGMDIIGAGDFSVFNENGKTVMTYRFPSIGGVDFVVEAGNMRSHQAIMQKIEDQKNARKPISKKNNKKRRLERKNKKKNKKK